MLSTGGPLTAKPNLKVLFETADVKIRSTGAAVNVFLAYMQRILLINSHYE